MGGYCDGCGCRCDENDNRCWWCAASADVAQAAVPPHDACGLCGMQKHPQDAECPDCRAMIHGRMEEPWYGS